MPRSSRFTIGERLDVLLLDTLEKIFLASYTSQERKLLLLQEASGKLDLAKFFLQIIWEVKALENKKYISISERLDEVGKMLGGWLRKTSAEHQSV